MESLVAELLEIHRELNDIVTCPEVVSAREVFKCLETRAKEIGRASCGSWIGYHADVYTSNLKPPSSGHRFDPMWGFLQREQPSWTEYGMEEIERAIEKRTSQVEIRRAKILAMKCEESLVEKRGHVISIIQTFQRNRDVFLESCIADIWSLKIPSEEKVWQALAPKQAISRDEIAMAQGLQVPPHILINVRLQLLRTRIDQLKQFVAQIEQAAAHMSRVSRRMMADNSFGDRIFIGHGGSHEWLKLEKFLKERLNLTVDEFNRVSIAGTHNIDRLKQMLDQAMFAILVMTAEDQQADHKMHARLNVIHEAGLFQGRLDFEGAIILLEDGCEEFSNIEGLGQIRFPKGNIEAGFEEIRRVLEDRGIIPG